jgi:hypothetical protein
VGEQCALTQPQLARAIGFSEHAARKLRSRWAAAGWAEGRVLLAGRAPLVWLTRRGTALAGLPFRPWRPTPLGRLDHIVAAAEARLIVAGRKPQAHWICERQLLRDEREEGLSCVHRPDAEVVMGEGTAAVEVELTLKSQLRWRRIARELLGRYDAVWYFAPSPLDKRLAYWAEMNGLQELQVIELPDPWRRSD